MEYLNEWLQRLGEHWQSLWKGEENALPEGWQGGLFPVRAAKKPQEEAEVAQKADAQLQEKAEGNMPSLPEEQPEEAAAKKVLATETAVSYESVLAEGAQQAALSVSAAALSGGTFLQQRLQQLERGKGTLRREQSIVIRQSAAPDEENIAPALEISRLFERDARRYDGEFMLYD